MADQKNVQSNQRKQQASSNRPSQQSQQGAPLGQQQANSNHPQQQRAAQGDSRQQGQGVERAQRSLADRERDEADRGAPDDLLPDRQPSGWTSRDV